MPYFEKYTYRIETEYLNTEAFEKYQFPEYLKLLSSNVTQNHLDYLAKTKRKKK